MLMIQHRKPYSPLSHIWASDSDKNHTKQNAKLLKINSDICETQFAQVLPSFSPRQKLSTFIAHSHDFSVIHSFLPFHVALHCTSIICCLSFKGTKRNSEERSMHGPVSILAPPANRSDRLTDIPELSSILLLSLNVKRTSRVRVTSVGCFYQKIFDRVPCVRAEISASPG